VSEEDKFIEEELDEEKIEQPEEELEEPEVEPEGEDEGEDKEVVESAKKYGHLSKEEWVAQGRDPDKYKTPGEFYKTGKVIEQLYTLKNKVDQRDREIQALIDYQQRTSQREYERAKQELEARLAASKDDMDVERVAQYSKELGRLQDNEQNAQVQRQQSMQHQAQQAFIERNQHWFNDRNPDLKARAIEIDNELKSIYPNATYEELAQKIETRMQYDYPERVIGGARGSRPAVSPGNSSVNKTAVNKSSDKRVFQGLSQELKDTYSAHKRIRASMGEELTESQFIEKLRKEGEIK
jgi:hypothetical protein